ncbi:transcription factor C subunit 7 [Fistulifera solaris]|uniref:Transcription factor C subunit 7 n=1 Tax=Fistulifera solaris TaxID=1519565 RepID=A0A1Z5KEM5_FISSO|nr:transcription factor C subunit 7 [Fistulifera solaris]|eukprot:GAX24774.1 transcription factor C subunit 7 [Fistulifera solaris]
MSKQQYLYIIRHGDRWDYENRDWTSSRSGDPPLSLLGHVQARETGAFLQQDFMQRQHRLEDITFLVSPFLRTIQTANEIIDQLGRMPSDNATTLSRVKILPEYSIFEWDGHNGEWHACLPSMQERVHYFPRIDPTHHSLFVPELPEPKSMFRNRCKKAADLLMKQYPVERYPVLVLITHAAGCVGLSSATSDSPLEAITPAAPCGIYRLTRSSSQSLWTLPSHDDMWNGHTDHLSDIGRHTTPWNHFGDKKSTNLGYTGPPNSRFAPAP